MRAKTLTTLLLAAVSTAAYAKPHHAPVKAVSAPHQRHAPHAKQAARAEKTHAVKTHVLETRHRRRTVAEAKPVKLHGRVARLEAARLEREDKAEALKAKRGHGRLSRADRKAQAKADREAELADRRAALTRVSSRHARGHQAPAPEPLAEVATPEPATVAAPQVHVTHDRKNHLKANPQDFMSVTPAPSVPTASVSLAQPIVNKVVVKAAPAGAHEEAVVPVVLPVLSPVLYRRGRLVMPPAMKGSHDILVHQNVMADADGLERVQDDADLDRMRAGRSLVAFPEVPGLVADDRLPLNRRYTRPWTAQFLQAMARAHYQQFHTPLQINSAVRTVEFQQHLQRTNGNAAPSEGETASPHLTGQAIDLAKKGLSLTEIAWMRGYLMPLVQQGKIDVEEEFQQSCFHISVYRRYMPQPAAPREIDTRRGVGMSLGAATMR